MNRIILIGNGFDLAHGLKTSYKDFIDDYWENAVKQIKAADLRKEFSNKEFSINFPLHGYSIGNNYQDLKKAIRTVGMTYANVKITFENRFLKIITYNLNTNNWVDVENEYYLILKRIIREPSRTEYDDIEELNNDFQKIKELLKEYLIRIETKFNESNPLEIKRIKNLIKSIIYSDFDFNDFSETSKNKIAELKYKKLEKLNFPNAPPPTNSYGEELTVSQVRENLLSKHVIHDDFFIPDQTLFLSFNYTNTDKLYEVPLDKYIPSGKVTSVSSIHIHGSIDIKEENPIIFGFGDELDDEYKLVEKQTNEYLENIKSIQYLDSDNYKKLLEFINSDMFQVFIFGHSCGISDRTLLNTIFEHDNCASVKFYYHQKEDGKNNFSDIIRNISRNFSDKAKMRDRVVNKKQSKPLVD